MNLLKFGVAVAALAVGLSGAASAQNIVIGTAGPMTGQYAAFGEQMKRGAEMAVADINAAGGVLGKKLTLEVGDDACDPKQAVAVANQMAGKKIVFMAGHFCSGSSIPASSVYNEEGILQMSPASTNPKFTEDAAAKGWKNIFRNVGRDDFQGIYAARFIADKYKGKKIAILHDRSAYGQGLAEETKKEYNKNGNKEAMFESYTAGERDYTALVTRMKAAAIDVIYVGGYHTEAALIVRQSREQGLNAQLISGDALVTDEFWKIAGPAGEGTLMTFAPDPQKKPGAAAVVAKFKAINYNPEGYTLYTYAAITNWADAVKKAGSTDTAKVSEALRSGKWPTVLGDMGFDAKGDVTNPEYVFYIWKAGKYAEM